MIVQSQGISQPTIPEVRFSVEILLKRFQEIGKENGMGSEGLRQLSSVSGPCLTGLCVWGNGWTVLA